MLPIVSLYSSNVELVSLSEVVRPFFIALASAVSINVLLFFVVPVRHNRGIVVLGFIVLFYIRPYLTIMSMRLGDVGLVVMVVKIGCLLLSCLVLGYAILYLRRTAYSLFRLTRFLNVVAVGSMLTALLMAGIESANRGVGLPQTIGSFKHLENFPSDHPDIFHIVLDGYARSDVLYNLYGYDNSPFIRSLEDMGFYVASMGVSNYHQTRESLSSMLNFVYHREKSEPKTSGPPTRSVRGSKVFRLVEELGYTTVAFASGYSPTEIPRADVYLRPEGAYSDFEITLLQRRSEREQDVYVLHRERVTFIMDSLETLTRNQYGRPLFVFAHIKSPHHPFVFGKDGEEVEQPPRKNLIREYGALYSKQAEYISTRMTEVLRAIRANFPDAIIVVHGDHGPRSDAIRGRGSREEFINDHVAILNALYLPGEDAMDMLYPRISLVNTYRVILNEYFDFELEMLEDYSYVAPQNYQWMSKSISEYTKVVHGP